jgi:hypothetical protein
MANGIDTAAKPQMTNTQKMKLKAIIFQHHISTVHLTRSGVLRG